MKFKSFKLLACLGILAMFGLKSSPAEAILASVKSTGMAATAIAYPQDAMAAAYNPAGIVWICDRLDVGVAWLHNTGHARVSDNASGLPGVNGTFTGMRTKNFYAPEFGIKKGYCCESFEYALGFVVYNRNFQKTTYNKNLVLFGKSHAGLEYVNETVAPVFAFRFCDCHSIGIAIDWQFERLKVNGLENFDNALFSSHPGHVTNRGYEYSQGVTATIGYRWQINDCLAIGATYQPRTHMRRLTKYDGFLAQNGHLDIPEKIGAGISWDPVCCVTLCFDWEYIHWSKIKALHNPLEPNLQVALLGDNNGPGFGFRNQNYYRVGAEYRINDCFTVRAGFRHANTPIRKSQAAVNVLTLDLVEDFVTVGGTWKFNECNEISMFYAYGFEHSLNGKGAIPVIPFGGGNVKIKEKKYALAIGWGWLF